MASINCIFSTFQELFPLPQTFYLLSLPHSHVEMASRLNEISVTLTYCRIVPQWGLLFLCIHWLMLDHVIGPTQCKQKQSGTLIGDVVQFRVPDPPYTPSHTVQWSTQKRSKHLEKMLAPQRTGGLVAGRSWVFGVTKRQRGTKECLQTRCVYSILYEMKRLC